MAAASETPFTASEKSAPTSRRVMRVRKVEPEAKTTSATSVGSRRSQSAGSSAS